MIHIRELKTKMNSASERRKTKHKTPFWNGKCGDGKSWFCIYTKKFIKRCRLKESSKCETATIATAIRGRWIVMVVMIIMMAIAVITIRTLFLVTAVIDLSLFRYHRRVEFKKISRDIEKSLDFFFRFQLWRFLLLSKDNRLCAVAYSCSWVIIYFINLIRCCFLVSKLKLNSLRNCNQHLPSDKTSYASDISRKRRFASSKLFGFLSGCHFNANFLYLKLVNWNQRNWLAWCRIWIVQKHLEFLRFFDLSFGSRFGNI